MTVQEFLYQIRRLAGDHDGNALSTDMLLTYLTEESGVIASLFPRQESITEEMTGSALTSADQSWIDPKYVYVGNAILSKMYSTEILRFIDDSTLKPTGEDYWALIDGIVTCTVSSGTARVVGNWKPSTYTRDMLPYSMVSGTTLEVSEKKVPALTGRRLGAVRYRMLTRCAEELGAFDRAQYYVSMSNRVERDLRNSLNMESTVNTGFMQGQDF